jgi:PKD repeat protein
MKKIYLLLILVSLLKISSSFAQCSLYPVSLSSRVNNSGLIIEGKVISQKSFWNSAHNYIYTSNLIQVNQVLKGNTTSSFIEIITEGGEVDMNKQVVEPALQLKANDEGVFTLNAHNQTSQFGYSVFQTYADQQGFIKFNLQENSAHDPFNKYADINTVLYSQLKTLLHTTFADFTNSISQNKYSSSSSVASVTGISPTTITAGTSSTLTITGAGFGATQGTSIVEFRNADDGGSTFIQPHSSQYVSWSNTQIQVLVPTRASTVCGTAGTGQVRVTVAGSPTLSAQTLVVDYGQLNAYFSNTLTTQQVFNTRHIGLNGMNGITWQMFTGFNANTAAKNSFLRAFQTWRCNTNINWLIGLPVSTNTIALDNVNVIRFDIGTELPVGVLGRCTSYFNGCTFGPNVYFFIQELDIVFDDATNWQLGPALATGAQFDFESVALHELGHGHQLSHVINNSDVMHYSIASAVNKRVLIAQDITAGNDVMSRNVISVCAQPAMTALAPGTCTVTAPTSSFNIVSNVCVGQSVALTNTTTGGASNYSWTITGGSPATSTLQNPSTSYAAAGVYSITLLASNGVGTSSQTKTINVVVIPTIGVTSNSICSGSSTTLTASGGTSYTWTPGGLTGANQTLNPAITTVYTVLGSNGTCTNAASGTVSVVTTPTVSVPNAAICAGSSTLITASGATNYTWTPGALNGNSQTLNPAASTNYTVKGANATCTNSTTFSITVNSNPTISVNSSATASLVCISTTMTLTASGATSYTFNPIGITTNPAIYTPSTASVITYTIDGIDANGCFNSTTLTHTVVFCTGISASNEVEIFQSIFPNPTSGNVIINFNKNYTGDLTVINALGQLILSKTLEGKENTSVDLTNYAKGIYVIKFSSDKNETSFIKVVRD